MQHAQTTCTHGNESTCNYSKQITPKLHLRRSVAHDEVADSRRARCCRRDCRASSRSALASRAKEQRCLPTRHRRHGHVAVLHRPARLDLRARRPRPIRGRRRDTSASDPCSSRCRRRCRRQAVARSPACAGTPERARSACRCRVHCLQARPSREWRLLRRATLRAAARTSRVRSAPAAVSMRTKEPTNKTTCIKYTGERKSTTALARASSNSVEDCRLQDQFPESWRARPSC